MTPIWASFIHTGFDFLAVLLALAGGCATYYWRFRTSLENTARSIDGRYFIFLTLGSITGAYLFGSLNLLLSGTSGIGRSIVGALAGATLMVEVYKKRKGLRQSTGYIYVIPFCIMVTVGRIGCLLSGLQDQTFGIPTGGSWGWDFGDHTLRHPVPLYESVSMAGFAVFAIWAITRKPDLIVRKGFYLCVGFYAAQRFLWEFFKPYGEILGPLNLFQCLCLVLVAYSIFMLRRQDEHDTGPRPA